MLKQIILFLYLMQSKIPFFFSLAVWILLFVSLYMGNSVMTRTILAYIGLRFALRIGFLYLLSKKLGKVKEEALKTGQMPNLTGQAVSVKKVNGKYDIVWGPNDDVGGMQNETVNNARNKKVDDADYLSYEEVDTLDDKAIAEGINLLIGQSVCVKKGVKDPDDSSLDLGGMQGRVKSLITENKDEILIEFEWDSISLKKLEPYLEQYVNEGLDYAVMILNMDELTPTKSRDKEKDVSTVLNYFLEKERWVFSGIERGTEIFEVIKTTDFSDVDNVGDTWAAFLEKNMHFPFMATVKDTDFDAYEEGMKEVEVLGVSDNIDVEEGVLVASKKGNRVFEIPLYCLEVLEGAKGKNYLDLYMIWFAKN